MSKVQIQDLLRLSPVQHTILKEETATGAVRLQRVSQRGFCLRGPLDPLVFDKTCRFLVDNTPTLRSSVQWEGIEKPVMLIQQRMEVPLLYEDWLDLAPAQRDARLAELCREEREAGLSLRTGPLVRLVLVAEAADQFLLLWTFHDLALDWFSVGLLMKEVCRLYEGFSGGSQLSPSPARSFKSCTNWAFAQDAGRAEAFWRRLLRDAVGDDRQLLFSAPGAQSGGLTSGQSSGNTGIVKLDLHDAVFAQMQDGSTGNSLRALVYGAWAIALDYYFGAEQIVFGANVDGREGGAPGAEEVCGPLENVLPFRISIPHRTPAEIWFDQLLIEWNELNQYAYCGLDKIKEWCEVPSETPMFSTAVVLRGAAFAETIRTASGEITSRELSLPRRTSSPLTLYVTSGPQPSLELAYDESILQRETVERLLRHVADLMVTLRRHPEQIPAEAQVLRSEERSQLLDWSQGRTDLASPRCIHDAFESQASQNPHALAIIEEDQTITYGQLNAKANQLANHLRHLGVGPEVIVGVYMPRSIQTVVALLAVNKSGGTYLPLDPDLPQERLSFLLTDAQPKVLLSLQDLLFGLPAAAAACEMFCLDSDWDSIVHYPETDIPGKHQPLSAAYLIYTSGSTGKPKGVIVEQGAAVAHLSAAAETFHYSPDDRVLQFAGLSFDVSIEQLLAPLSRGASLVLKPNVPWGKAEFFAAIHQHGITVANVPPSFWAELADATLPEPGSLRLMIIGGDTMSPETVRRWQSTPMRQVELLNAYGPTEAVITAAAFRVPPGFCHDAQVRSVPIGKALPHRSALVLNHAGDLSPIGVWGEMCLGGSVLARGYLNRPGLTAEKFIPDPFSQIAGARLYRTGDIARYRDDGLLDFMGRKDSQVKIRGFRIELPEIELALAEHPDVSQTLVVVRSGSGGEKRLAAYAVPRQGCQLDSPSLREFMKQKLPEYMVPAFFQVIDAFPLTASGKVDRNRLPDPAEMDMAQSGPIDENLDRVQSALTTIWAELLGVPQVGLHDDFFDLGGDSLLATQVVARAQKALGVEIPLRVMFDTPTIADLARFLEVPQQAAAPRPELRRISRDQEIPLSPAQERLWFLSQTRGQASVYNMTGAVKIEGPLDYKALEDSFTEIVKRHEALRTVFPLAGDHPVQKVLPPYPLHLPPLDLSHMSGSELERELDRLYLEEDAPMDLANGPLFRPRLLRLAANRYILLATLHHIAGDAWSLGIVARDLSQAYTALSNGDQPALPPLTLQYPDFACWQRELLEQEGAQHLEYWRKHLGGYPSPATFSRQSLTGKFIGQSGATHSILLPPAVSEGVKLLAQQTGSTLFMTLLAALKALLSLSTGATDVVVGTDIANRNHADTENIIGFFVNVLALRTEVAAHFTFVDLLSRVREVTLGAYQHQDLPFNRLIEDLNPSRSSGDTSLFKVFFYMPVGGLELLQLAGLKTTVLDLQDRTAKFDLSLQAQDTPEGILCAFNYKTDLFEDAVVQEIAEDFQLLLQAAIEKPEARLTALKSAMERGKLRGKPARRVVNASA